MARLISIALALGAAVAPAAAAANWSPVQRFGRSGAWSTAADGHGGFSLLIQRRTLAVARAAPGQHFGRPRAIPGSGISELTNAPGARLAGRGRVAAWLDWDRSGHDFDQYGDENGCCDAVNVAALRSGRWTRARRLSPRGVTATMPLAVELPRGRTVLVWTLEGGTFESVVIGTHGTIGTVHDIASDAEAEDLLDATLLHNGRLLVTYAALSSDGKRDLVRSTEGRPDGAYLPPRTVLGVPRGDDRRVLVATSAGGGQAAAVGDGDRIDLYVRRGHQRFSRRSTVVSRDATVDDMATTRRGHMIVLWHRLTDRARRAAYRYATGRVSKGIGRGRTLFKTSSLATDPTAFRVALTPRGGALAFAVLSDGPGAGVIATSGSLNAGLGSPRRLSPSYSVPDIDSTPNPVVDGRGRGVLSWQAGGSAAAVFFTP